MYKKSLLLLLGIACVQFIIAQNLPSTLLWRISGNNLQKPSYLYGTMHLTDERLFNLGDSVYKAIENSEGFATEIDPQEFTPFMIDETKKSIMQSVRLKDKMSRTEFNRYGKILAKKLNKNADDITTADVLREKNKWISDSYRTGKMQTFLDVYLFDIARRQGKWTGGVEDIQDQEGLIDLVDESDIEELALNDDNRETKKEYNLSQNTFIKIYLDNNLNAIDSISNLGDSLYEDALLVKRNKKMAMRMDSLGHIRSMVFAVGAAHLPGDKGLIALLKQKGFTVEPVFSSKKIKSENYKVADIKLPWQDVKDPAGFYKVSMPGKPGDLVLYGILTMKMYFDVFTSTAYITTAMKTPYTPHMADSMLKGLSSYYFGEGSYAKGKPVNIDGVMGRELFSAKKTYTRGYLLNKDGVMYIAIGISLKADTSGASSINRFMHSFKILHDIASENSGAVNYVNNAKAYRLNVPAQPKPAGDLASVSEDSTINRELNVVSDPANGAYLFFGSSEAAPGYYIQNDSAMLSGMKKSQEDKFLAFTTDTIYTNEGRKTMELAGIMQQFPLMMRVRYIFRGNRWYAMVAMYDTAKNHTAEDNFFSSFEMLDYTPQTWRSLTPNDNVFTTWAPAPFRHVTKATDDEDSLFNYETYDSTRGDNYSIVTHEFTKYYWQNSDSALWDAMIDQALKYNDTLLSKKPVSNGESKGYEILIQQHGSQNIRRLRMLLNGNRIYKLLTAQPASEINNVNNNRFFEDFRFTTVTSQDSLFISKAPVLLKDITSEDSATRSTALARLETSPFTTNELPLLHAALLKNFPKNEYDYNETKNTLRRVITGLKDTSSYQFAKKHYAAADDETKEMMLSIMASFPTRENFNDIKNLLLHQPPHTAPGYSLRASFEDTLELSATVFPELLPLIKDTNMAPMVIKISYRLLDKELMEAALLQPYQPYILELCAKKYKALQNDADDYDATTFDLVKLLGRMNNSECNAMLQKWSMTKNIFLQQDAAEMLLKNKQAISPVVIQSAGKR